MHYVHTNIISNDWENLANFYIEVFHCEIVPPVRDQKGAWLDRATGIENAHLIGAHLRLPGYGDFGPTLEIYQYTVNEDRPTPFANRGGFGHIAFEVEDVPEILENVIKHGGSKLGKISQNEVIGIGTITVIYVRDPDGNIIELQNWNRY